MIFWTPNLDYDLLGSIFVTLLKKLSLEVVLIYSFQRQFLQLCFKYASKQIKVKIGCSKYQKLFKTLIINIFQNMYCCTHKTATLKPIQHTVPPLVEIGLTNLPKCRGTGAPHPRFSPDGSDSPTYEMSASDTFNHLGSKCYQLCT